jgi:hypothetical protein
LQAITMIGVGWSLYLAHALQIKQMELAAQQILNHQLMNSRLDQLVQSKVEASHAIGMAEGTEQARLRAIELLAKGVDDAKATVDKIIERHGNGPDERLEEIRGES